MPSAGAWLDFTFGREPTQAVISQPVEDALWNSPPLLPQENPHYPGHGLASALWVPHIL